jgi:hypothetical protein
MIIDTSLAPPLRRALATLGMLAAGHAGAFRALQARPELPPAGVDRVEVVTAESRRVITDRAAIDRILGLVGSYRAEWTRFPDTVCLLASPSAAFYEGAEYRGSIVWTAQAIVLSSPGQGASTRMLSPREAAELRRLVPDEP